MSVRALSFCRYTYALVCSAGARSHLHLRPPLAEGRSYVHTQHGLSDREVYEEFLVLTPWFIKGVWELSRTQAA